MEKTTIAKALSTLNLLEKYGQNLGMPCSKKVASNLFELRMKGKQQLRIFYTFYKNEAILLHHFIKKSQRIPKKELKVAKNRLKTLQ